ncbi:unnamed protein product [Coregonus sp. 'balchen']|nr:unnamed protein product [Coregonus sp. 'balchen']
MLPRVQLNSSGSELPPMPDEIPVQTMVLPLPAGRVLPIHIQLSDEDFFLSLNLPAFIIRGELLLVEVTLFKYLEEDLESHSFEFVFPDNEELSKASTRTVSVWSQNGTSVLFPIRPLALVEIPVSAVASDAVSKMVLVKGLEQSLSKTMFLEPVRSVKSLTSEMAFSFPADVVEGSQRAQVTAVGYESELSYQRDDGSFSASGDSHSSGSTWLSAFVLKCFLQASPFISIDSRVLSSTATWLGAQQGDDGAFMEPGRTVFHPGPRQM